MSFNNIVQYAENLRTLEDSEAWKNATEAERLELHYRLFKSKYGLGSWFGFGEVKELWKGK